MGWKGHMSSINVQMEDISPSQMHNRGRARPSDAMLADAQARDFARQSAEATAQFCGDPPPGYSALDLKRHQPQPPARRPHSYF